MKALFQMWLVPALDLPETIQVEPNVSVKVVKITRDAARPPLAYTLIQMEAERPEGGSLEPQFRVLGKVLSRLSLALLMQFNVVCGRVIPTGLRKGEQSKATFFMGSPPGVGVSESKFGYQKTVKLLPEFLVEDLPAHIENAIGWFMAGNAAGNSIPQVLYHWIGLESLAPVVQGPWRCPHCEANMQLCPACGEATTGPKTVQTVRSFLRESLGVSKAEYQELYLLRNRVAHGSLPLDQDGLESVSKRAGRIQELLLTAIKRSLGWPLDQPPLISPEGLAMAWIGMDLGFKMAGDHFYDDPGMDPPGTF